ncbi:MAG: AAA family ATPase, partial [Psychrosphaera sp.]|nr:AAA family ATPase [Psychrosphaera sp.]
DAAAYFQLTRTVSMELVYWLEVADMKGRTCKDLDKQLALLEEFKMFAQEYGLWQVDDPYHEMAQPLMAQISDLNRGAQQYIYHHAIHYFETGQINMLEETIGKTFDHRDNYANVVIMCGPSGSGKSSWITKHLANYAVVSLDDIRHTIGGDRANQKNNGKVMQMAKEQLRISLREKRNVVWDATNLRSDFRKIIADLARDYHALITLVVFQIDEAELLRKDAARQYRVGSKVLEKQLQGAQWPLLNEAHRYCIVDKNGDYLKQYGPLFRW